MKHSLFRIGSDACLSLTPYYCYYHPQLPHDIISEKKDNSFLI